MALEEILAHKRMEVARRKAERSLESILAGCAASDRPFAATLAGPAPRFILEIKFASPSAGVIRPGGDVDPVLESYGRHADLVSVLTDERYFGGSLDRLTEVRRRIGQPLLAKDFVLEPFQVAEARRAGADAVLLILAAIDDATWRSCAAMAARLGMAVVTEVHDEAETERAVALGAVIIGVNNRDLNTLAVDLGTTPRLASRIPKDRLVICESGISARAEIAALRAHAQAFLIGSALMREPAVDAAVRRLVYGMTKICGLTRPADARAAWAAGATHGGLVFAPDSPRHVSLSAARSVRDAAALEWVGVFAGAESAAVAEAAVELGLSAVQLHGGETAAVVAEVRRRLPRSCPVWKAVRAAAPLPRRAEYGADRLLFDGGAGDQRGGTGRPFDWALLADYPERAEVLLAGGLTPENVEQAAALDVAGLDVSSGVEANPGEKDHAKLGRFMAARRRLPGRGEPMP